MSNVINEEICFEEGRNFFSISANKDCKLSVFAAWEISNYCESNDRISSRAIPIRDLFLLLRDKDVFIHKEVVRVSETQITFLNEQIKTLQKFNKEQEILIYKQKEKIEALKIALKELKEK